MKTKSGTTNSTGSKKSVIILVNGHPRRIFVNFGFAGPFFDYYPSCSQWMWTEWGWQRVWTCDWPWGY